jgi:site-specific recombinase XerD
MFEQLFKRASTIARHTTAPFAEERSRYLEHCGQRGDSFAQQLRKADHVLWIARKLSEYPDLQVTIDQIRAVVGDCSDGENSGGPHLHLLSTRKRLIGTACAWLRYLGCLRETVEQIPFGSRLGEYCAWAEQERGLSDASIERFRRVIRQFLRWYGVLGRPLSGLRASDVDAYLAMGSGQGWKRVTIRNVVDALRAFLRFGAAQGWCPPHLPASIQGPRLYALEGLPAGPTWAEVERLFAGLDPNRPAGMRDRAILMLFAIYGLRESEVATLRLDDIDWEHDQLRVPRAKRRDAQVYPLLPSVGNALIQYLQSVRRRSSPHREVFLAVMPPYRPLSRSGLYDIVAPKLKSLNVQCAHRGPHSLRHACATRLVTQGLPLKEIGDHLGHRSTSATGVYAKVDLAGLREVAVFDLGELL